MKSTSGLEVAHHAHGSAANAHGSAANAHGSAANERGSVTVVMVGVTAAVLMLTVTGLLLASAVLASHRARAAADLAALAGAGALIRGEPPRAACELAARIAVINNGLLQSCMAAGPEVWLTVEVDASVRGVGKAYARSRAGPKATDN